MSVVNKVLVRFASGVILKQIDKAAAEGMYAAALSIEGQAKINIVQNNQVDTGFMLNSGFALGLNDNDEGGAWSTGVYPGAKSGKLESRRRGTGYKLKPGTSAAVVWSAIYSFWQELQKPFLIPAAQQVGQTFKLAVEMAFRRKLK